MSESRIVFRATVDTATHDNDPVTPPYDQAEPHLDEFTRNNDSSGAETPPSPPSTQSV